MRLPRSATPIDGVRDMANFKKVPVSKETASEAGGDATAAGAEKAPEGTLETVNAFIQNEALYIVMIGIIVIFLGYQFSRWALRRDFPDEADLDLRNR